MADEIGADILVPGSAELKCPNCETKLTDSDRFCRKCGFRFEVDQEPDIVSRKWNNVRQLLLFFIIEAVICASSHLKALHNLGSNTFLDIALAVTTVVFVSLNWKDCKPLLVWNNFSLRRLTVCCFLAVVGSVAVNIIVDWLNESLWGERESFYLFYSSHKHAALLTIFFVAVAPAIFEELAFRVFLLGKLLAVFEKNQAVFISAFMFGIIHMSFISLFWLIPFGLIVGYFRIRQNTMWYGTCIHFCFNLTATIIDIAEVAHRH
jgi:membrane protease YdiL (CAAX protease family)